MFQALVVYVVGLFLLHSIDITAFIVVLSVSLALTCCCAGITSIDAYHYGIKYDSRDQVDASYDVPWGKRYADGYTPPIGFSGGQHPATFLFGLVFVVLVLVPIVVDAVEVVLISIEGFDAQTVVLALLDIFGICSYVIPWGFKTFWGIVPLSLRRYGCLKAQSS